MKIEGKNLFPLILSYPTLKDGYYIDREGAVYSTRGRNGKLSRLFGSSTLSGRYFSLQGKYGSTSFRADDLAKTACHHKDFNQHTADEITMASLGVDVNKIKVKSKVQGPRNHAADVDAGIAARGSIIGRVHKGHLVFGSEPKIHTTEQSVKDEMQRLAVQYPGVKFVELKIAKSVVAGGVTWA